jgi:HK97 family phage major capsid protein
MPYVATGEAPDRIGEALASMEGIGFAQPFILMNPAQWNDIRTGRTSGSGEYTAGSWAMPAPASIWGAPVIRNSALPVGTALIVDRTAARYIDRQQTAVEISSEDSDNFRRNLATILCETRGTVEVTQPADVLSVALDTSP